MTKVSVIMSVYNGMPLMKEAIQSIQSQTLSDFEFLIVNDCSTDETKQELHKISQNDERIRVIENEKNLGLAASLNKAWQASKGEFIARMDSDDISESSRLEEQVGYLEKRGEVVVLGTSAVLIDQKGELFGKSQRRESHHELVKYIGTENPFFHSSVMMRKRFLIETGGYNEKFRRSQDYDLWSRGIATGEYHNLQKFLLKYRVANKISWSTIRWGAYSKFCHAWRQKKWLCSLWYPVRFMVGSVIVKYRPTK